MSKLFFICLLLLPGFISAQHDSSMINLIMTINTPSAGITSVRIVKNNTFKQTGGWTEKLKDLGKVNIVYDYNHMGVCEYSGEKTYLESKQKKYSSKKYTGFLNEWYDMRKSSMEPKFREYFNKYIGNTGIMGFNDTITADATLRVEVLYMDPEDHRFDNLPPPYIKTVCSFFSKEELLARYEFIAVGSREKNARDRLTECFAVAGKMLAKGIVKKMAAIEKYGPINSENSTGNED